MKAPLGKVVLGWMVHAYTASGLLIAAIIANYLMQAEVTPNDIRICFLLMIAATFVDATDGTLARAVDIKETVPSFDGRRLDDLTDFLTYTCLPLWLVDRSGVLPDGFRWVLLVALIASAYGFCQTNIKSPDGSFVGFPSYWNIISFFLYAMPYRGYQAVGLILVFSFLTFVPSRYPYPTRPGRVNRVMLLFSIPWAIALICSMWKPWDSPPRFAGYLFGSLLEVYPACYLLTSWITSLNRTRLPNSTDNDKSEEHHT